MNLAQQDTSYEEAPESEESLYDRLYDVLLGCMEDQLASTAEVGVLLGGFDSALVASLLCRLGKRVHTYSFRYADAQYNLGEIYLNGEGGVKADREQALYWLKKSAANKYPKAKSLLATLGQ